MGIDRNNEMNALTILQIADMHMIVYCEIKNSDDS